MTKFKTKHKAFALTKMRAAALIIAALLTPALMFTGCKQSAGGSNEGGSSGGSSSGGGTVPKAPFVEGGASLILSPDKLDITVEVTTSDNSPITVEGCDKLELTSGTQTELKAKGTKVVLKGKITELYCYNNQLTALNVQGLNALQSLGCRYNKLTELNVQGLNALKDLFCENNQLTSLNVQGCTALESLHCEWNQLTALDVQGLTALKELYCYYNKLTALNVQGCTALQKLYCSDNQLTADAFTKLFNDLPQRIANEGAQCYLYSEYSGVTEGNHKDFTSPGELKTAFDNAKTVKNWKMYKWNKDRNWVEI